MYRNDNQKFVVQQFKLFCCHSKVSNILPYYHQYLIIFTLILQQFNVYLKMMDVSFHVRVLV